MDAKRAERTGDIWQARSVEEGHGTARYSTAGKARQDCHGEDWRGLEWQSKAGTDYQQRRQQWH
jgi:hypothetical protein